MKLIKLTLHRSKRLHLNESETIVIEGGDDLRSLILRGVSGIGKSTVLAQLSPLPPNMRDFYNDGYKEITIEHKGKTYTLKSTGSNAGKHSFLINGVEHNISASQTTQYELVKEHFNYDDAIHRFMLGLNKFTLLSGAQRRSLFSMLSNTDNDFITDLWEAIRTGQRDNAGALKNIEEKIAEQTKNLLDEKDIAEKQQALSVLKKDYEKLVALRHAYSGHEQNNHAVRELTEAMYESVERIYNGMMDEYYKFNKLYSGVSPKDIESKIQYYMTDMDEITKKKESLLSEIENLNQQKHQYQFESEETNLDIDTLKQKRETLVQERAELIDNHTNENQLYRRVSEHYGVGTAETLINALREKVAVNVSTDFVKLYSDVVGLGPIDYNAFLLEKQNLTSTCLELTNKLQAISSAIDHNNAHLVALQSRKVHTCPQCNFQYREDNADEQINTITINIDKLKQSHMTRNEELNQIKVKLSEEMEKYQIIDRFVMYIVSSSPYCRVISNVLLNGIPSDKLHQYVVENIGKLNNIEKRISDMVSFASRLLMLDKQIHQIELAITNNEKKHSPEYLNIISRLKYLNEEVDTLDERFKNRHELYRYYSDVKYRLEIITNIYRVIQSEFKSIEEAYNKNMTCVFIGVVTDSIRKLLEHIDTIEKTLTHRSGIMYVINHLKENQVAVEGSIDIHKKLMAIMNPKDGLIAKTQVGFIRQFISEMNNIIKQVWTYPLVVTPDDDGHFMKDFKIPVYVGGKEGGLSKDVFETSTGQSEIIDLAFRLVMMKYLHLEEWPIYADELGASLNPKHRYNLYGLLKRMVDENRVSQLYVITHLSDIENILIEGKLIELKTN